MSLERFVQPLISDGDTPSRLFRAIKLFEFQVALLNKSSFYAIVNNENDAPAPTPKMQMARNFAAIKILEKIETDLKKEKNVPLISIRDLAAIDDYRAIFDDVIAANGGWFRIRHSMSAGDFDRDVNARSDEARAAANIVDFSYRFSSLDTLSPKDGRENPGGLDSARYVARTAGSYRSACSETTIKNRWREYRPSAIFLYLIFNQKVDLRPPRLQSKSFVDNLLRQSDDVDSLRRFFNAYEVVRVALSKLKYPDYPALHLDFGSWDQKLEVRPFLPDVQKAFNKWQERS